MQDNIRLAASRCKLQTPSVRGVEDFAWGLRLKCKCLGRGVEVQEIGFREETCRIPSDLRRAPERVASVI